MSVTTPNMSLIQPTINVDSGLVWENGMNANTSIVDGHNHTAGFGVQIPPAGLNINANLSFQNNQATNLQASVYTPQVSLGTLLSTYVIGNDLYFNDGASNVIRITTGGTVNATSSGITSGTASASFTAGVLIVNAASNTPANIQGGSILLGNNVAASKFLTLSPPAAMASNTTETLPTIPGVTSIMQMDSSGNMSASLVPDASTIAISAGTLLVPANGITATQLASNSVTTVKISDGNVTRQKLVAVGQQMSSSSGGFTSSSGSYTDVTNLTVTLTTTGRPIVISLTADGSGSVSGISLQTASPADAEMHMQLLRGAGSFFQADYKVHTNSGATNYTMMPPGFLYLDVVGAGTYTYKIQVQAVTGGTTITMGNLSLVAYEL